MTNQERIARKLEKCATILETKGWCKGSDAQDKNGNDVSVGNKKAVCYCARGVIIKVTDSHQEFVKLYTALTASIGDNYSVIVWNDSRDRRKRDVVRAFTRAAKLVRQGKVIFE